MIKKIAFIGFSLFLAYQSYKSISILAVIYEDGWLQALIAGIIFNLFITGVFAFLGFALPTQRLLPERYYTVVNVKSLKKWYRFLRVDAFRGFLLATFWRKKEDQKRYFDGTKEGLTNLSTQSKKSEFGHLIPFLIIAFITIYIGYLGFWRLFIITWFINILFNFYPILLQRHHRMRIQRMMVIAKRKSIKD